jgi:hypothetical protein
VRADPLDPHDALLEVDGHDQSVIVPLDVEDDPVGRDNASSRVAALYIRRARPPRLSDFIALTRCAGGARSIDRE